MDNSTDYLSDPIIKALIPPSTPDYLLENAKADIEIILTLKDNEQRKQWFEGYTQRLQEAKKYLREAHIETPYPKMVDDFLRDFYAYIDEIDQFVISGIEDKKANSKKYRDLQNKRDGLFNRWCVILRAETNYSEGKTKQAEKKLSEADLASTKPSETKQNALLAKNEEQEGVIVPKPPEFLQTLLWLWRHGKKHWKLILLAAIIMLLGFILQLVL